MHIAVSPFSRKEKFKKRNYNEHTIAGDYQS